MTTLILEVRLDEIFLQGHLIRNKEGLHIYCEVASLTRLKLHVEDKVEPLKNHTPAS